MVFNLRKAQYFYFITGLFDMAMHLMHISQAPRYGIIAVARVRFTQCKASTKVLPNSEFLMYFSAIKRSVVCCGVQKVALDVYARTQ